MDVTFHVTYSMFSTDVPADFCSATSVTFILPMWQTAFWPLLCTILYAFFFFYWITYSYANIIAVNLFLIPVYERKKLLICFSFRINCVEKEVKHYFMCHWNNKKLYFNQYGKMYRCVTVALFGGNLSHTNETAPDRRGNLWTGGKQHWISPKELKWAFYN